MRHGFCKTCKHREDGKCVLLNVPVKPGDWCKKHELKEGEKT